MSENNFSLKQGTLIEYPYIWKWQADKGQISAAKNRPTCFVFEYNDFRYLLPITTLKPKPGEAFIEVPSKEALAAGLDDSRVSYVILSESNAVEASDCDWYLAINGGIIGAFTGSFIQDIIKKLQEELKAEQHSTIGR